MRSVSVTCEKRLVLEYGGSEVRLVGMTSRKRRDSRAGVAAGDHMNPGDQHHESLCIRIQTISIFT